MKNLQQGDFVRINATVAKMNNVPRTGVVSVRHPKAKHRPERYDLLMDNGIYLREVHEGKVQKLKTQNQPF
jgi:hypothetical protein